ncbi:hypothetical protein EYF80_045274 [Liparis tanakae]|uniref:Uncharacterized protein n=1 Tax=Liparis tanakae TaxID=230148 RepID=A0A4Z2FU59_9TELE|nr:hypothetical protein EYF80_045274 [Liparis tanakae]
MGRGFSEMGRGLSEMGRGFSEMGRGLSEMGRGFSVSGDQIQELHVDPDAGSSVRVDTPKFSAIFCMMGFFQTVSASFPLQTYPTL